MIKPDEKIVFYYSPYLRTQQTLDIIKPFFDKQQIIASLEEPRLSEQQIGNFQDVQEVSDISHDHMIMFSYLTFRYLTHHMICRY